MVRLAGFEPTTLCLEGRCSIQLSYRRDYFDERLAEFKTPEIPTLDTDLCYLPHEFMALSSSGGENSDALI